MAENNKSHNFGNDSEKREEEADKLNKSDLNQTVIDLEEYETEIKEINNEEPPSKFTIFGYRPSQIKWSNVIWLLVIHCLAVYGYIHVMFNPIKFLTLMFTVTISFASGFGMLFETILKNSY
jgi:hypothetical protein